MAAVTKFGCAVTALIFYYVSTKKEEDLIHSHRLKSPSTSNTINFSSKSEIMDEISKEQMGDLSLEELEKNISDIKKKRGTS